jgi:tRNA-2-methylthio-N6-dimethylallyladenosine synthase
VPDEVASARLEALVALVRGMAREQNLAMLGRTCEVLIEKDARKGDLLQARTRDFKTVLLPAGAGEIGSYLEVTLNGTTGSTFTGQVVRKERAALPLLASA